MTNQEVKEYLRRYEYADKRMKRCEDEYEYVSEMIDAVRLSTSGDGMPHGSGISRAAEDFIIRLADKQARLLAAQDAADMERTNIIATIQDIKEPEQTILYERYVQLRTWDEIADRTGYTVRHVHNLHGNALMIVRNQITNSFH